MPDQNDSPASPLANLLIGEHKPPELTILSGLSGAGKSAWCIRLAEQARTSGLLVGGVVSPAVWSGDRKVGIDLVDLSTSERRRLAVPRGLGEGDLSTYRWQLDGAVLDWGNHILGRCLTVDLLILDELGPLELERGQGLQAGLTLVDSRQMPLICAVVRPALLDTAQKRWPWARILTLSAGQEPVTFQGVRP